MPLKGKDREVMDDFKREYGDKTGERRFYASINAGKVKNIPEARRIKRKNRASRRRTRR